MDKSKRVIISYQDGKDRYIRGQQRLHQSLIQHWEGDNRMYNHNNSKFRSHLDNPYAFKLDAFNKALEEGFEQILYVDCSMWAVKDVTPIFDRIESNGHLMQYAGHWTGTWTNDYTLNYFDLSRDKAMEIPMFSAGFMGLDFAHPRSHDFFRRWQTACDMGTFQGRWDNRLKSESNDPRCEGHRHDMSSASIIAYSENMEIDQCGDWFSYVGPGYGTPKKSSIFYAQGL